MFTIRQGQTVAHNESIPNELFVLSLVELMLFAVGCAAGGSLLTKLFRAV